MKPTLNWTITSAPTAEPEFFKHKGGKRTLKKNNEDEVKRKVSQQTHSLKALKNPPLQQLKKKKNNSVQLFIKTK